MRRILFCWELGKGHGHISKLLPLALGLRARGHEVLFAVRDLFYADILGQAHGIPVVQAPVWQQRTAGLPEPVNYAEILFRFGYLDSVRLLSMVSAWRQLFRMFRPSLLVVDHGPTALLAARGTGIPTTVVGTGFELPPPQDPLPSFRPWETLHPQRLASSDRRVLDTANRVLQKVGGRTMGRIADLFDANERFLCTFPELEHYPGRVGDVYRGALLERNTGEDVVWPPGEGARIFAYVSAAYRGFDSVLAQLRASGHRVILHAPGFPGAARGLSLPANITLVSRPVRLRSAADGCDLAICHAGHGTVAGMLLAGKPMLLLQMHLEQQLLAMRVKQLGAALSILPGQEAEIPELTHRLADEPGFRLGAERFARGHAGFDEGRLVRRIVERIEDLLA